VLENLVHVGALDSVEARRSRRELLWRAVGLGSEPPPLARSAAGASSEAHQLTLTLDEPIGRSLELPAYSLKEETEAELAVTGIDARRHMLEHYSELVAELGCVPAAALRRCRNRSLVLVAGVKVSSQTPAIRSGQRIIFLTIEDTTGPVEVTVFERAQPRSARTVFHSWLLLVAGEVRKRGGASLVQDMNPHNVGVTVVAEEVFDLAELAAERRRGRRIDEAVDLQRKRQAAAVLNGGGADSAPARLWHASGGSAGR
jgi:error-prone DNA polymerase